MAKQNISTPILPSVYQETLTYGETLGVVAQKVNECIDEVNTNDKKVDDLTNLVGTFDGRITDNTNNIIFTNETLKTTQNDLKDAKEELAQFKEDTTNNFEDVDGQISSINDYMSSVDMTATDALNLANTLNSQVQANTAAIAKSKEKMTLLSDITISQDTAGAVELISNTKISTFYVQISIKQTTTTANGQLRLHYANDTLYLTGAFARNNAETNIISNGSVFGGIHEIFLSNHSYSSEKVLGSTTQAFNLSETVINRITFVLLNNVPIPAGSTFKVYGILED